MRAGRSGTPSQGDWRLLKRSQRDMGRRSLDISNNQPCSGKVQTMYSQKVMDHFSNPRNVGELPDANGKGEIGNAVCGDIMVLYIKVDDGRITDAKFQTFGCGAAIASSSIATELIKGKTIDEALEITNAAVIEALEGLPPAKIHCSVLAEEAIRAAVQDYKNKNS